MDEEVGGVCVMKWDGEVGSWMVIYLHCDFALFNQLVSEARQSFKNAQQLAAIIEHITDILTTCVIKHNTQETTEDVNQ